MSRRDNHRVVSDRYGNNNGFESSGSDSVLDELAWVAQNDPYGILPIGAREPRPEDEARPSHPPTREPKRDHGGRVDRGSARIDRYSFPNPVSAAQNDLYGVLPAESARRRLEDQALHHVQNSGSVPASGRSIRDAGRWGDYTTQVAYPDLYGKVPPWVTPLSRVSAGTALRRDSPKELHGSPTNSGYTDDASWDLEGQKSKSRCRNPSGKVEAKAGEVKKSAKPPFVFEPPNNLSGDTDTMPRTQHPTVPVSSDATLPICHTLQRLQSHSGEDTLSEDAVSPTEDQPVSVPPDAMPPGLRRSIGSRKDDSHQATPNGGDDLFMARPNENQALGIIAWVFQLMPRAWGLFWYYCRGWWTT